MNGIHAVKVEIVAVYMMCYECAKVMGRWPSPPVKFRHGGVRMWFCEWPFFCAKLCAGNKELICHLDDDSPHFLEQIYFFLYDRHL